MNEGEVLGGLHEQLAVDRQWGSYPHKPLRGWLLFSSVMASSCSWL